MNFADFYKPGSFGCSFEVFPPKTSQGITALFNHLTALSPFNPAFISVTYGAMGSTRDLTGDLALRIRRELKYKVAFHFTCIGSSRDQIRRYVEHLKNEGLNLVVALRGDRPAGLTDYRPPEDAFRYANELVAFLKEINGFSVAVAGYPEGHSEAPDKETDLVNLKRKVTAGAALVITQLFFDNRDFYDFEKRARGIGILVPIIPGIMPIVNVNQIEKIAGMCGARIPDDLHQRLIREKDNENAMRDIGVEYALKQCRDLKKHGVPGIHFYILNKSYSVKKILQGL